MTADSKSERGVMISAQFRIQLPPGLWVGELSQQYPETTFRLLSGYSLGDYALELGELIGAEPLPVVEAIRNHSAIRSYELLESDDRRVLGKYETTDIALYEFVETSALTIEFPVDVRNGWYEFSLTGTQAELDRMQVALEESPLPYELRSLVGGRSPEAVLTDRQREVIEMALRKGYFEVPRECTLAELADTLDIDPSTASTVLRRGQGKLVKAVLSGPEDGEF